MVEVKVQEFDLIFSVWLVHLPHILSGQHDFPLRFYSKQINDLDRTVRIQNIIQVNIEGNFSHFWRARYPHHFGDAALLPKNRYWAANLYMRKQKFAVTN
jgi:hypothetical protein